MGEKVDLIEFVKFRPQKDEDRSLILNSWLKSFRNSHETRNVPKEIYYVAQEKVVEDTIDSVQVLVAHHLEDVDHVLGYIVFENDEPNAAIIHYVFVKQPYRKFGIARSLWEQATKDASECFHTHTTYTGNTILEKHKSTYNPYKKIGIRI